MGRLAASFAPVLKVGVRPLKIDVSLDLDLDDGSGPFAFGTLQDRFLDVIFEQLVPPKCDNCSKATCVRDSHKL